MAEGFHDINSPGFNFGGKKEDPKAKKPNTGIDDSQNPPKKEPPPVEYRIKYVRPLEPENGFRHNKAYDIEGEIEPLVEKITQPRIVLYPIGIYNGAEDNFFPKGIEVFPDKDGKFRVTCDHLFNAMDYDNDYEKPADATWVLVIRAQGRTAEKDVESEPLTFPQPEKAFINLREGHYDDNGASQYQKPREGGDYVSGDAVKRLQQDLITLRFLPKGENDGFFGSKTDAAVKDFQKIAIDKYRMPFRLGKLIEAESTLQQSSADGIVGPKTRDEIDLWKKKEWVKPAVVLRHGEYDDDGVNNRKGERGGDDHHIKSPVKDYQQDLQKIDAYSGALDGWFFDKMQSAVKLFQEYAEKGQFLINGVMTDIGEKLTGHNKGTLDIPTQEMVKKVAEKGAKVPLPELLFPLPTRPTQNYTDSPRSFGCARSGERKHAGCDLYAPEGATVLAVKDGTVILGPYPFYKGTIALEVDHGDFIVRYTEMKDKAVDGVKKGATLKAGQIVGYVGKMDGLENTMLHFEMYSGKAKGPLTDRDNPPYKRRQDLLDPTKYLDKMKLKNGDK